MSLVNVKFRNTAVAIESDNPQKALEIAAKLNRRAESLINHAQNITDTKLAIVTALMLEDQVDNLVKKVSNDSSTKSTEIDKYKASFAESLSQIADYLNSLCDSIDKK